LTALIGTAHLGGQAYELRHTACESVTHDGTKELRRETLCHYTWYQQDGLLSSLGGHDTPADAIDALWRYLGPRAAPEGWWQPAEGVEVDISAAKLPRTVTEREVRLGLELSRQLHRRGLMIDTIAGAHALGIDLGLAYQIAAALAEDVRVEEQLEQLAVEHDLVCELIAVFNDGYAITRATAPGVDEQLATGDTPAEAVEALRRELEQ